jgi:hypothetical protein
MRATATCLVVCLSILLLASSASAVVGWCGNVWPVDGTTYTSEQNIDVYAQVWKEGVTDSAGQGAGIAAAMFYRCQGGIEYNELAMSYNTDTGNNDEYTATIPSTHGCTTVEFHCVFTDSSDMSTCDGQDQSSNDPPFALPITSVTAQDVTVTFHLCLSGGVETTGAICVSGDHVELTNWGSGAAMSQECPGDSPNVYTVDVLFASGGNPSVNYKYRKDDCAGWEATGNRQFTIDDSGSTMDLPMDSWEFQTIDCPPCETPIDETTWGTVKALYR